MDFQHWVINRRYWTIPLALWGAAAAVSFHVNVVEIREHNLQVATEGARTIFKSLVMTRMWNAEHGGVYVRVGEGVVPNPYLIDPKREVRTTDGETLTLINPAYMTRMISELARKRGGLHFHITSLKPLNPGNQPDDWERNALEGFGRGLREWSEVLMGESGEPVLRYMAPLVTEPKCLHCHAVQGYKVGDIRGGISINQPYAPFRAAATERERETLLGHVMVFVGVTLALALLLELLRRRWLELRAKIRELGDTQVRMLQAEKMAAVGELAAGVAHHLNTPLGFVKSNLGTLRRYQGEMRALLDAYDRLEAEIDGGAQNVDRVRKLKKDIDYGFLREDSEKLIDESLDGIDRVGRIVGDLRAFSRAGEASWQCVDLHSGFDATVRLAEEMHPGHPEIIRDYDELPMVRCVPALLNQALLSLLDNAIRATPAEGRVTLRTRRRDAGHVTVECIDTGVGIERDVIDRVIEPFFTARHDGRSVGMGLPLVYSIVREHGGDLEVESEVGAGATFRIVLPVGTME